MEFKVKQVVERNLDVKYIEIHFPHEDEGDEDVNSLPFIDNMEVRLLIDIETGQIQNYPKGVDALEFAAQVDDDGSYRLYDSNMGLLHRVDNAYVPNKAVPPRDGYGDNITLEIDENGLITNWYSKDEISLQELFENTL